MHKTVKFKYHSVLDDPRLGNVTNKEVILHLVSQALLWAWQATSHCSGEVNKSASEQWSDECQ